MKYGYLFVFLFLSMTTAFACQKEAQFIGTILKADCSDKEETHLTLHFNFYKPSMVCPLDKETVREKSVTVRAIENCDDLIGQELSGVLVLEGDKIIID